jgi:deoxycytidine triphosphate deaminase
MEQLGYLTDYEIEELIDSGVIVGGIKERINSSSLDLHLGATFKKVRTLSQGQPRIITLDKDEEKDPIFDTYKGSILLESGECCLASTQEVFNLPDNISFDVCLRSTAGRKFLNHMLAGHADAGWHGSSLTLEFKNELPPGYALLLREGDRAVQIRIYRHNKTKFSSYAQKGGYNNSGSTPKSSSFNKKD